MTLVLGVELADAVGGKVCPGEGSGDGALVGTAVGLVLGADDGVGVRSAIGTVLGTGVGLKV